VQLILAINQIKLRNNLKSPKKALKRLKPNGISLILIVNNERKLQRDRHKVRIPLSSLA
jgi:ribonucleotide monophosphatase NagD (HAD superfamily)